MSDLVSGADLVGSRCVRANAKAITRLIGSVQDEPSSGRVLLHQPGLIEECDLERACLVEDERFDERPHSTPANRPRADRANLDYNGCLLAGDQGRDRARFTAIARKVL